MRLTEEEWGALQERMAGAQAKRPATPTPSPPLSEPERQKKPSKYRSVRTEVDGHRFDSKAEARRYIALREAEKCGDITDLRMQVAYDLLPEQTLEGITLRGVRYVADFVYRDKRGGREIVEDVKSGPTKTKEFQLKKKMMAFFHGIEVREVYL